MRCFLIAPKQSAKTAYNIKVTSYNAEAGQTDASPCIGASGEDQCALARAGERIIALSQDLVGNANHKPFHYGDYVWLEGDTDDERCKGRFLLLDTMNARYTLRGDLFFLSRSDNTSCNATVYPIP